MHISAEQALCKQVKHGTAAQQGPGEVNKHNHGIVLVQFPQVLWGGLVSHVGYVCVCMCVCLAHFPDIVYNEKSCISIQL